MSGKYVAVKYSDKYGYWLSWGNETFYDEKRAMRTWTSAQDATTWLKNNHPNLEINLETKETKDEDQNRAPVRRRK